MDNPSLFAIGRPSYTESGNQVAEAARRGLQRIAQSQCQRQVWFDTPLILREQGHAPLRKRDQWGSLGNVVAGGNSTRESQQGPTVLFQSRDRGLMPTVIECRRQPAAEDKGAIEGIRVVVMNQDAQRRHADFQGVLVMRPQEVIIYLQIAFAIPQLPRGSSASREKSGNLQAGSGRERYLVGAFPCEAYMGLIQKSRAQREDIREAQVLFADGAVVTGFGKNQATTPDIVGVVHVGRLSGCQ